MEAPEEFTWLFRHEYAGVVWSANLVLHDHALAEETAQDAFVRLLENWRKVSRYDRPGSWVRLVAVRMATRVASRRSRLVSFEDAWPSVPETRPLDIDLIRAIRQLPPKAGARQPDGRGLRPHILNISQRPAEAEDRAVPGH
jgi:DNA-directed RNA polymerase specialized sigma24 family protein